jgi:ribonucleotide reductase alpha subunit
MKYSREEVLKETLKYFNGEELPANVWINKYALKDSEGNLYEKSPEDMHRRIAKEIARIESKYTNPLNEDEIFDSMKDFKYIIPQGSPMAGIGNDFQISSISNCFVVGAQEKGDGNAEDSYGSVLRTDQEIIQLCKRRAGVGTTLEHIRPSGTHVKNAALTSTGVVPFMERYSNSIREVAQCLRYDTNILTKDGLIKIKDVSIGMEVWTENGWVKVINKLKNTKDTIKVTTKYGNEIICSEDHIFHTLKGEKRIKDVKIGEKLSMINGNLNNKIDLLPLIKKEKQYGNRIQELNLPKYLNDDIAYLLGYMYGDGSIYKKISNETQNHIATEISLACDSKRPNIINKLKKIFKEQFGKNLNEKYNKGNWINLRINSQYLYDFLIDNFIAKEKSDKIKFPELIKKSNKKVQMAFISGYFDADGSYAKKKKSYRFHSINREFLTDVKLILQTYGILSKISKEDRSNKGWKDLYTLSVPGASSKTKFYESALHSCKVSENILETKRDCFISNYKSKDILIKSNYNDFNYVPDNSQYLSLNTIERLKKDKVELKNESNLYQDELVSKDFYEKDSEVYDLTLENTHLFWANGFYVHNSGRRGALMLSTHVKSIDSKAFIDAKLDTTKVTGANISVKIDDAFMDALNNEKKYIQQFPIVSENPIQTKEIDPKEIWDKLIENNYKSAEPGVLFWDTIEKESIPDCYADQGFKSIGTNPCVVGDTMVSVADGRNYVSIKQLAEEGNDIPVYTLDNNGELCIRTMRNPRISNFNQKIYKVNIEGGHSIRVTGNHKFRLKDGSYKEAKDLVKGDSLHIMTKWEASFDDIFKSNSRSSDYFWINDGKFSKPKSEHRFIYEQFTGNKIDKGYVIHHKDFNSKNNSLDNLELLTKKEHDKYHGLMMEGNKNPYHKMEDKWKFNFASHPGESNPNYSNISNDEIIEHFKVLTKKLDRRISYKDWQEYAKENNLPQVLVEYRQLGNVITLSKKIALELGYDNIDVDPRLVKTYKKALDNGYDAEISNNEVLVTKYCEECGEPFQINYFKREVSFCSSECSNKYLNTNKDIKDKRTNSVNNAYLLKATKTKEEQVKIYSDLKFELNRIPKLSEWEDKCKELNTSCRLRTKHGFKNFKEVSESAEVYNHKVVSVIEDGYEDVYNGTVDDFHNYFTGFEELTKNGKKKYVNVNQLNCGEIVLCDADSCRLLLLNLYSYVENPFTKDAKFNFDKFSKYVRTAQRYMDDIVDIELEQIDKILNKIESDPESEDTKFYEKNLWQRIRSKCEIGRRTGTGVTGEGDMLAALGIKYGTKEATNFSIKVHQTLALNAFKESVNLAKERGKFKIYDSEKEKNNPFLNRLFDLDPQLKVDMEKYGRRNIALLTIAPAGCLVEDTKIKTDNGEITLAQLFLVNGYDLDKFRGLKNIWLDVHKDIYVENIDGKKNKITKLYWNGESETKIISLENDATIESTLEHKFLVKLNDKEAIWKKAEELKIGDKIIQKK